MNSRKTTTPAGRKAAGQAKPSTLNSTGKVKTFGATKGRGRKKAGTEDDFSDLDMNWEDGQNDISSSWSGSIAPRKSYVDDAESDSYEGTGYARGRMSYELEDELTNDPYETFRRG